MSRTTAFATIGDMFIEASRLKLRFATSRGEIPVEDLWALSLPDLDRIGISLLDSVEKHTSTRTLLKSETTRVTKAQAQINLQFSIVKHIIDTKQAEIDEAKDAKATAARIEMLEGLLGKRQLDELEKLSPEQLALEIEKLKNPGRAAKDAMSEAPVAPAVPAAAPAAAS